MVPVKLLNSSTKIFAVYLDSDQFTLPRQNFGKYRKVMKFEDSSEALKSPGQGELMFFDIMAARIGDHQHMVCPIWLRAVT